MVGHRPSAGGCRHAVRGCLLNLLQKTGGRLLALIHDFRGAVVTKRSGRSRLMASPCARHADARVQLQVGRTQSCFLPHFAIRVQANDTRFDSGWLLLHNWSSGLLDGRIDTFFGTLVLCFGLHRNTTRAVAFQVVGGHVMPWMTSQPAKHYQAFSRVDSAHMGCKHVLWVTVVLQALFFASMGITKRCLSCDAPHGALQLDGGAFVQAVHAPSGTTVCLTCSPFLAGQQCTGMLSSMRHLLLSMRCHACQSHASQRKRLGRDEIPDLVSSA